MKRIHVLGLTAALPALAAMLAAAPLHAQTANASTTAQAGEEDPETARRHRANEDTAEEAILVTGYRSSNVAAIEAKRDAVGIRDSIAQDQAGLLPDLTIAQVAQRIVGVALVPDFATSDDRSPDLAESVMIRGIGSSYNLVTIDGMPLATTSPSSRGARIELLPPSFVSRIDAAKTITANLDPHALSGQLDLITASAFDTGKTTLVARASVGDNSTAGQFAHKDQGQNFRGDLTYSSVFGANRDFGVVLSGSYARYNSSNYDYKPGAVDSSYLLYDDNGEEISDYNDLSTTNGWSAAARNQIFAYTDSVERASGVMKLEYDPGSATYASLYTGYFYQKEDEVRNEYLAQSRDSAGLVAQDATSGTWAMGRTALGYSHQPQKRETFVVSGLVEQDLGGGFDASLKATHSRARLNTIRDRSKFQGDYNEEGAFAYDLSSANPQLTLLDPGYVNDPATYNESYIQHITQRAAQDLTFVGLDVGKNFAADDYGLGFNVGASFQNTDQSYDENRFAGNLYDVNGDRITLVGYDRPDRLATTDPRVDFLLINDEAVRAAWEAAGYTDVQDDSDTNISSDYELNEKVYAAYAQARYRTENFNVLAGLRFDATENDIDLWVRDANLVGGVQDADSYSEGHRRATYQYLLPSVIASYRFDNDVVLRAGYSKTIGRPNFNYYAISEAIGLPDEVEGDNIISVTRGNADLKPRTSNNFDLSLEWYPTQGSMLSVAAFYKDIKNLIFTQNISVDGFEYQGDLYTARITTPMNAQSASLKGVEVSARQDFRDIAPGFLGNFVLNANATYIKGKQTVIQADESTRHVDGLEGQPEFLANASLSYEDSVFGASIAYSYVGDYLKSINEDSQLFDIHSRHRSELSAQIRLKVLEGVTVIAEGQNLTKTDIEYFRKMPDGQLLAERAQKGRTLWLGVNARF
ncbi:TonB-dependent receptor [Novosphingobium decolorationis]|uniref:TonB-dependent receptor n=1 Tax=Novosphingobium decolorationis TaxID=2698673 RepID=A0ABX8E7C0_9SPHN|nr:TonB-dependent receptor [Novosphingobium decolorationis]QVM84877.1 TonB-dependent receptor [Novosphingobium decolorationis]